MAGEVVDRHRRANPQVSPDLGYFAAGNAIYSCKSRSLPLRKRISFSGCFAADSRAYVGCRRSRSGGVFHSLDLATGLRREELASLDLGTLLRQHLSPGDWANLRGYGVHRDYEQSSDLLTNRWLRRRLEFRSSSDGPSGPTLFLSACSPELGIVIDLGGRGVFGHVGERCCGCLYGHILQIASGFIYTADHGNSLELVSQSGERLGSIQVGEGPRLLAAALDGSRWFFARDTVLQCYSDVSRVWETRLAPATRVSAIAADAFGRVAAGTYDGLIIFVDPDGELTSVTGVGWPVDSIAIDRNGSVILAGSHSVELRAYEAPPR